MVPRRLVSITLRQTAGSPDEVRLCSAIPAAAQERQHGGRRGGPPPSGDNTGPHKKSDAGSASTTSSAPPAHTVGAPTDEFFVISSIDKTHNALVLLRATQITATVSVDDKTTFAGEDGKPLKLSDFRTGDTIFAVYETKSDATLTAKSVRKGRMTIAELRRRYLPSLPITPGAKK